MTKPDSPSKRPSPRNDALVKTGTYGEKLAGPVGFEPTTISFGG